MTLCFFQKGGFEMILYLLGLLGSLIYLFFSFIWASCSMIGTWIFIGLVYLFVYLFC